jgi:hypothetical protein
MEGVDRKQAAIIRQSWSKMMFGKQIERLKSKGMELATPLAPAPTPLIYLR